MRRFLFVVILLTGTLAIHAQLFSEPVKPLIKTQWSQREPYNLMCPKDSITKKHKLAGCGPVAMAQIMKYYQYPKTSPDGKLTYKYDEMFDEYVKGFSNISQITNISHLIVTCGISAFTSYGNDASSTRSGQMIIAMQRLLGYSPYMHFIVRDPLKTPKSEQAFADVIFKELKEGRPIMMFGNKPGQKAGHIFIVDGCKGDKVHLNLGWGEEMNGYYKMSDLGGYTENVGIIVGIAPATVYTPHIEEFNIAQPGSLCSMIDKSKNLSHIKVTGTMDKNDLLVMRLLAQTATYSIDMEGVNMEELPDSAFYESNALVYIKLPKNLKKIGRRAFMRNRALRRVDMPATLTSIGRSAFLGNYCLIRPNIPNGVKSIGSQAFSHCTSIVACAVPESVETIGAGAFENCDKLKILRFPASAKRIGKDVVKDCKSLQTFTIPDTNPTYRIDNNTIVEK